MDYEKLMELIQKELDGDLSVDEKLQLEMHFKHYPADRDLADRFNRLHDRLIHLPQVSPKESIVDSIIPQIDEELSPPVRRISKSWKRISIGAGAGIAAMIAVFFLWQSIPIPTEEHAQISMDTAFEHKQQQELAPETKLEGKADKSNGTMGIAQNDHIENVISPTGEYIATWEQNRLVVNHKNGAIQFESEPFSENRQLKKLEWKTNEIVRVILTNPNPNEVLDPLEFDMISGTQLK
ncbi:hypothetical protein IC620_01920 [Hazenella sp. IB182357]|uniref:Uncharacterized protein n=1 Tax=Polycladospora coralii TaxID=2771432 RepID=A0A926RSF6_9BACL|nr:hypothetical protein [Polycladospora coralii]MBD1371115.1 hypothetical protein [Polycladospora coralii]MBS7530057.1 hypothetical protein [Polycladospora coralii]